MALKKLCVALLAGSPLLANAEGHGDDEGYTPPVYPEPIYAHWDSINKQHTFHAGACHQIGDTGTFETKGDVVFQAYLTPEAGAKPVYQWWDNTNKQHTFHFKPAWTHGGTDETTRDPEDIVFYAFENVDGMTDEGKSAMCQVHAFWHAGETQHRFHCGDAWEGEVMEPDKPGLFWTFKEDYVTNVDHPEPVHAHWDNINKQHSFHFPPAQQVGDTCDVETRAGDSLVFFAWRKQNEGTVPIYAWWDDNNKQHTFHQEPAWTNGDGTLETKEMDEPVFYAYNAQDSVPDDFEGELCQVHAFWEAVNNQHNFHCGEAWNDGEVKEPEKTGLFWAFPETWTPSTGGAGGAGDDHSDEDPPDAASDKGQGAPDDEDPPADNATNATETDAANMPDAIKAVSWMSVVFAGLFW